MNTTEIKNVIKEKTVRAQRLVKILKEETEHLSSMKNAKIEVDSEGDIIITNKSFTGEATRHIMTLLDNHKASLIFINIYNAKLQMFIDTTPY